MKRVLIIAGEASGDLHGSALMRAMTAIYPDIIFRGIGGSRMVEVGLDPIRHVRDMNFMGFVEVVRHLPFIRKTFADLHTLVSSWQPDLAILIDYPGFNLRMARKLKQAGIPVMYYISPQLWAWHTSRVKLVRKYVDRMVVIFPFETDFYRSHGIEADFVGHPLIDTVHPSSDRMTFRNRLGAGNIPLVGLLPGSRKQEIERILPAMVGAARVLNRSERPVQVVLGCAGELDHNLFDQYIGDAPVALLTGETYDIMAHADALMVTSGTATLEAGICGTPMVIVYRTSPLTYHIGRMLVDIDNIGMINIVAGSRIVPELWQNEVTPAGIADAIEPFLSDTKRAEAARYALGMAREKLGDPGGAHRAAAIAQEMLGLHN